MRKLLTGLLLLLGCICLIQAQKLPWNKASLQQWKNPSLITQMRVSYQLEKRLERTYRQAKQAQTQLPPHRHLVMGEPIQAVFRTRKLSPALYPPQTFLTNSAQTGRYLAARNNRLFLQEIQRMEKIWTQIDENLSRLQQEALDSPQPQDPIKWLSERVPEQTTQLFVGEYHGHQEIHQAVSQLAQYLRNRQPQREIFLFTEFLPENFIWQEDRQIRTSEIPKHLQKHFTTWEQALEAQVPVIGLELPAAMGETCQVRYLNARGKLDTESVWESLEGVRLRNERWKKTLAKYRAKHPNALFIIYTGAYHSMYNRPFTLATPNEQTFVTVLYPNRYRVFEPSGRFSSVAVAKPMKGPLERLVDQLDFQRQVVMWQSPDLPHITGFDVRIKIPVKLRDIDY